jgi:hypothetical protein
MNMFSAFASDFPPPTRTPLPNADDTYCADDDKSRAFDAAATYGCVDWFIYPESPREPVLVATVPV